MMTETGAQERGVGGRPSRAAGWLAWSICGVTVVLIACAVALAALNRSDVAAAAIFPLALTVSAMVGGLVASRRPKNPVGWFFLGSAGCLALSEVADEYVTYGLPGTLAMAWLMSWLWVPGAALLLIFLPLYFPDGRVVSPRWRWLVRVVLVFCVGGAVYSALSPGEIPASGGIVNPLGIEALRPVSDLLGPFVFVLYF
ncbi:MAG: hypothetical protein M3491_07055, partial [Actinomycetota bacterium]|nr:hypothetical protein [Actinomycetota bacterium]